MLRHTFGHSARAAARAIVRSRPTTATFGWPARRLLSTTVSRGGPALFRFEAEPEGKQPMLTRSGALAFDPAVEVQDKGGQEAWAIVGPATEGPGEIRSALTRLLLGQHAGKIGVKVSHPFLRGTGEEPTHAVQLCTFLTRLTGAAQGFVDYSVRYGAIRDEDRLTLYESLMDELGVAVGNVAHSKLVPDPFNPDQDTTGIFKWPSETAKMAAIQRAHKADAQVHRMGKLLLLGPELLERPLIALSNGQTRRARILAALLKGGKVVVLEEPFTGLDPPTRSRVTALLHDLHQQRDPRIVLVLRPQDTVPDFVTHLIRIDEEGRIVHTGPKDQDPSTTSTQPGMERGGYDLVRSRASTRRPDEVSAVVQLDHVTISYPTKQVLTDVSFTLGRGSHTILVGDNGSGKTTLLALLLGDHPQSYALPAEHLKLFGHARADPVNATVRLRTRVGHFSPELFNAFPRRAAARGGLTVEQAIASGLWGIFSARPLTDEQRERVRGLLALFQDVLVPRGAMALSSLDTLAQTDFSALTPGSQAVVLFLRAVVHQPELLVLDEPFQGMDAKQVARVRAYVHAMHSGPGQDPFAVGSTEAARQEDATRRENTAVVLVSHYESEWIASAYRLVRLRDGHVVELL